MWCNNCLGDMDVMEIDIDKDGKRFKNFVLMIGEEVLSEMAEDLKDSSLHEEFKIPGVQYLIQIAVVKAMVNLQTKNAYTSDFVHSMVGDKVMDKVKESFNNGL